MILDDLLNHREAEADAVLLAVTHKGLEQALADWQRDARAVVRDADLKPVRSLSGLHLDSPRIGRDRFAGVKQQVMENPLQLARVKPTFARTLQ